MDVTGKYLIVSKHVQRNGKTIRRAPHDETDMELMTNLATDYAEKKDEDFLIVKVVREVSRPKTRAPARSAGEGRKA